MNSNPTEENPKVRATSAIWGFAIGMLGVCIPLVAITESGIILPLLVALSATGGTAAVWLSPEQRQREEASRLAQRMKRLEERVIDLETIYVSLPDVGKPLPLAEAKNHQA